MPYSNDAAGDVFRFAEKLIIRSQMQHAERQRQLAERRNTPEARAVRAAAARRGWERRRAREAAERAVEAAEDARGQELDDRAGPGPWCDSMDIDPVRGEVSCILAPGHEGDCEDVYGHSWANEDDD